MLPVPEGCVSTPRWPAATIRTATRRPTNDGWAAFSGTSAATPQVAGVCALIKQACPRLTPAEVRDILMTTARDVTTGTNHPNFGNTAVAGPDTATGNGLVDAHRAVLIAKLRCISIPLIPPAADPPVRRPFRPPVPPIAPLLPIRPVLPFRPIQPIAPAPPIQPFLPLLPFQPLVPVQPFQPFQPLAPLPPIQPFDPGPGPGPAR